MTTLGYHWTKEQKEHMSKGMKKAWRDGNNTGPTGYHFTKEQRERASKARKKAWKKYPNMGATGYHPTKEQRRHRSESLLEHNVSRKTRRLISEALLGIYRSRKTKRLISESSIGRRHSDETKEKMSKAAKLCWENMSHKEQKIKIQQIHVIRTSKPQRYLHKLIKVTYPSAKLEYHLRTNTSSRILDIALPRKKIDIEFDGGYWHRDRKYVDRKRDKELYDIGWKVIRLKDKHYHKLIGMEPIEARRELGEMINILKEG
jgi:hypothetical protein